MADAEARREARRRKILQNSESRMNQLLGKPDNGGKKPSPTEEGPGVDSDNFTPVNTPVNRLDVLKSVSKVEINSSVHQSTVRTTVSDTNSPRLSGSAGDPPHDISNSNVGTSASDTLQSPKQGQVPMDPVRILDLLRAGGCVLAAFVTRWSLTFGLGLLFFEWILLPFLILEGSLYYFQTTHMKDIQLPHRSSMMAYALILSGVKPDIISKYNLIMGYITAVSEDFAFYLFTFLVFHAFMG